MQKEFKQSTTFLWVTFGVLLVLILCISVSSMYSPFISYMVSENSIILLVTSAMISCLFFRFLLFVPNYHYIMSCNDDEIFIRVLAKNEEIESYTLSKNFSIQFIEDRKEMILYDISLSETGVIHLHHNKRILEFLQIVSTNEETKIAII